MDFARSQALALRLVQENGQLLTFRQLITTPTDATKPWRGPTNPRGMGMVTAQAPGVAVPPSSASSLGWLASQPELLKELELIYIVAPGAGLTVNLQDYQEVVDAAGVAYRILLCDMLAPDGATRIVYFVGVCR